MARIKHIALTTKDPAKVAGFYKEAFGLREIRRAPNGAVFLTDGRLYPTIKGSAFVNAEADLILDGRDPFCYGIRQ